MRPSLAVVIAGNIIAKCSAFPASHPAGAIPSTLRAPSTSGFKNAWIHPSAGGLAICVSGIVPVNASTSQNMKLNFQTPETQIQVTGAFLDMYTAGSSFPEQIKAGLQTASGMFDISSTLCVSATNLKPRGVQILSHGVPFTKAYWDFGPGYSFVDVAIRNGYAAFFYDRLGSGGSSKPDAINVAQAPLEVDILYKLVKMLKAGDFIDTAFSTVVGVGHSYGSSLTQAITAAYPDELAAAVLTGFGVSTTAIPVFMIGMNLVIASQDNPARFAGLPNGYITSDTFVSNQNAFFRSPNFDPRILSLAEATKGTMTFGQMFGAQVGEPANYTHPVAVVNGANDLPFCFGNCSYPTNHAAEVLEHFYPKLPSSKSGTFLAPGAGHGLNLHYSGVQAFLYIQTFLSKHGLGL